MALADLGGEWAMPHLDLARHRLNPLATQRQSLASASLTRTMHGTSSLVIVKMTTNSDRNGRVP
jgi:hypothetical protein